MVINYREGGLQTGAGGASEVLPLQKGGAGKVLAVLKVKPTGNVVVK